MAGKRRKERERAFQVLYSLCFTPAPDVAALKQVYQRSPADTAEAGEPGGYGWELARGVWENTAKLDAIIDRFSHRWRSERMGKVELTLLRMAVYELYWRPNAPGGAIINEAMELASEFGETGALQFVRGILDAAVKNRGAGRGAE